MDKKSRKKSQRRAQRKGKSFLQQGKDKNGEEKKSKTPRPKAKEQKGCSTEKKFLCSDEGHEKEKHIKENRKQSKKQDKQEPKGLELLVHTHVLWIPELGLLLRVQTYDEEFDWEDKIPDLE